MDLDRTLTSFRLQEGFCAYLGSPLYSALLGHARADIEARGAVWDLIRDFEGDPLRGFLALRVLGAVHEQVLAGRAPALARFYPTAGGCADADADAAWPHFRDVIEKERTRMRPRLERFPQTNEVRRCAGLLGGFLLVAQQTGLPLRLLEIGCSAGLNLQWSQFRYDLGAWTWGDAASPVAISTEWNGDDPGLGDVRVEVRERSGCDIAPRAIDDDEGVRDLECFVWADQPERLTQLRAAVEVARRDPPDVREARAGDWLPDRLSEARADVCTVVYHSSVWAYVPSDEQRTVREAIESHGAEATSARPLAWLRAEASPDGSQIELRLRVWPDGRELLLGEGHAHGRSVSWHPRVA